MQSYKSSSGRMLKNVSITSTLTGVGVASGLILDALILGTFGIGHQTDAFFTALTLPLLLSSVFSIQCPKALIPVFAEYFSRNDQRTAWGLLSNLVTSGVVIFGGICCAGVALSGVIVPLQIPGLDAKTIALAASLCRILFWLVLSQGLASILQSVLYAQQCYVISSSGKLVINSVTIIAVALGRDRFGIQAVAIGMLLGGFVQVAALVLALSARGFRYRWVLEPGDPKLRGIVRSFRYPLAGHMLSETGMMLQNFLGSFLGSGNLTVVRYASRIVQAISAIFLGSVAQVTFPLLAKYAATNDLRAQRKTLLESIQLLSVLGLPVCTWLIFAAQPMIILLFERGAFSRADAAATSVIVGLMSPEILLSRIGSVTQTLFYANKDMRTPFISMLIYTVSHTVLAVVLVRSVGVAGLPIAVALGSLSYTTYLITKAQRRFGPIGWSELRDFACRLVPATATAAVGFTLGTSLATVTTVSDALAKLLNFVIPTAFGMCAFIIAACLFRLIDGRVFLPGGERHRLFFDRSA